MRNIKKFSALFAGVTIIQTCIYAQSNMDCKADVNADAFIDMSDVSQLVSAFDTHCTDCPEDISQDGIVNITDFLILGADYGKICNLNPLKSTPMVPSNHNNVKITISPTVPSPEFGNSITSGDAVTGDFNVSIYPNPNNGRFEVELKGLQKNVHIMLYNSAGRQLLNQSINLAPGVGRCEIDLGAEANGLYTIVLKSGSLVNTKKIIVR